MDKAIKELINIGRDNGCLEQIDNWIKHNVETVHIESLIDYEFIKRLPEEVSSYTRHQDNAMFNKLGISFEGRVHVEETREPLYRSLDTFVLNMITAMLGKQIPETPYNIKRKIQLSFLKD